MIRRENRQLSRLPFAVAELHLPVEIDSHDILLQMFSTFLGEIWRRLPAFVRRRVSTLGQTRFVVSVAAMLFDEQGRILLLEHVFRADRGWGVPGGFIGRGEQPEDGLRRELREEIDVEIDNLIPLFSRTLRTPGQVEIYFRARVIGEPKPSSFEIKQAQWFSVHDLPPELSKDQRKLIQRAMSLDEKSQ